MIRPFGSDGQGEHFIAVFYSGIGSSLLLAGILFDVNFGKAVYVSSNRAAV